MRKKLEGGRYTMLETRKDGTKFTNKALREVADRLQGLSKQYESRQHQLVDEVSHPALGQPCVQPRHPQPASMFFLFYPSSPLQLPCKCRLQW